MKKHTLTAVGLAALLGALGQSAGVMAGPAMKQNIVGLVTNVGAKTPPTVEITVKPGDARQVRTDAKTQYVKWTHTAELQGTRADASALTAGRCVDVEPWTGQPSSARIVRISEEPSGSAFDPCKAMR